MNSQEYNDVD